MLPFVFWKTNNSPLSSVLVELEVDGVYVFQGLSASLEVLPNPPDSAQDQSAPRSVLEYFAFSFSLVQWFQSVAPEQQDQRHLGTH